MRIVWISTAQALEQVCIYPTDVQIISDWYPETSFNTLPGQAERPAEAERPIKS